MKIENPSAYEVRSVMRFLIAKKVPLAKLHGTTVALCAEGVVNEGNVKKWCRLFKVGRTNVYDEERSRRLSLATNDMKNKTVNAKILETDDSHSLDFKKILNGRSLRSGQETKDVLQDCMKGLAATFFGEGTQVVPRHDKCLNLHDNYVQ